MIKRILGEADEDAEKEPKAEPKAEKTVKDTPKADEKEASSDGEPDSDSGTNEIALMWKNGNKDDVVEHLMQMDNETAVKLVFAIGKAGALELAKMVDSRVDEVPPDEDGFDDTVGGILGKSEGSSRMDKLNARIHPRDAKHPDEEFNQDDYNHGEQ